jgi:hypothetical protein
MTTNDNTYISKGVRKLKKNKVGRPSIVVPSGQYLRQPCLLSVEINGELKCLPISRKVAEVLIAKGFPYEG